MLFSKRFKVVFVGCALVGLSGCAGMESVKGWENRYGPDPAMPQEKVSSSVTNAENIMGEFKRAGKNQVFGSPMYWQDVMLAGFNYVDGQCDAYLHELFAIDSERTRFKKALDATGLLTSAVMTAVPASKISMGIVTQAFGLSGQYVDTAADSYLYGTNVSAIMNVVEQLQKDYVTKLDLKNIQSEEAVFRVIRGYLRLCLPPVIQGHIDKTLTNLTAESTPKPKDKTVPKKDNKANVAPSAALTTAK